MINKVYLKQIEWIAFVVGKKLGIKNIIINLKIEI